MLTNEWVIKRIPTSPILSPLCQVFHTVDGGNDDVDTTTAWSNALAKQLDDFGWILGSAAHPQTRADSSFLALTTTFVEKLRLIEGCNCPFMSEADFDENHNLFTDKCPSIGNLQWGDLDENRHFIVPPRRHSFPPRKRSRVCTHFVKTSSPNLFSFGIEGLT